MTYFASLQFSEMVLSWAIAKD